MYLGYCPNFNFRKFGLWKTETIGLLLSLCASVVLSGSAQVYAELAEGHRVVVTKSAFVGAPEKIKVFHKTIRDQISTPVTNINNIFGSQSVSRIAFEVGPHFN